MIAIEEQRYHGVTMALAIVFGSTSSHVPSFSRLLASGATVVTITAYRMADWWTEIGPNQIEPQRMFRPTAPNMCVKAVDYK